MTDYADKRHSMQSHHDQKGDICIENADDELRMMFVSYLDEYVIFNAFSTLFKMF